MEDQELQHITALRKLQERAHETSRNNGFWDTFTEHQHNPDVLHRIIVTFLALISDESHEALSELRRHQFDAETAERGDYVRQIPDEFGEELADVIIRTMDLAAGLDIDLASHVVSKIEKNRGRPRMHGKNF